MSDLYRLNRNAAKINQRKTNEAAVIDDAIIDTKADFAQFHGISLITTDPITGEATEYTTLDIDTGNYDGTTNNAIDISLDGGITIFTTAVAHADDIPYVPPRLYYTAPRKILDGTKEGGDVSGVANGSTAYDILMGLGIASIMA